MDKDKIGKHYHVLYVILAMVIFTSGGLQFIRILVTSYTYTSKLEFTFDLIASIGLICLGSIVLDATREIKKLRKMLGIP